MTLPPDRLATLAQDLLTARARGTQIAPVSETEPGFDMDAAHQVAARIRTLRLAMGEVPEGRKIGFTNRALWPGYNVDRPIWGDMFDSTLQRLPFPVAEVPLPPLTEPKIEPEIVLGLHRVPYPGMDIPALAGCIGWVALGFEVVTSPYPGWRFGAADAQAAFGLHGMLCCGPPVPVMEFGGDLAGALSDLEVTMHGEDTEVRGKGRNALDGPVQALSHLVAGLAETPGASPLASGEIVTTGTLVDPPPLARGQRWRIEVAAGPLAGLDVTFT